MFPKSHRPFVLLQYKELHANQSLSAGIHRVVGTENGRQSLVFALRHGWKHDIDMSQWGGEGIIGPKELYQRLKIGVVNINADQDVRDKQRRDLETLAKKPDEISQPGHG
jgi:hypothetical protein